MLRRILCFFIVFLFFPFFSSFGFDLYINSIKAPVYKSPSIGSEKMVVLSKGTSLTGIELKSNWYHVKYKNIEGWVYKLMAKKTPPLNGKKIYAMNKVSKEQMKNLAGKARRRPSSYATTAAARALRNKDKHFSKEYSLNFVALEKIESIEISDEEALEFLSKGISDENDI